MANSNKEDDDSSVSKGSSYSISRLAAGVGLQHHLRAVSKRTISSDESHGSCLARYFKNIIVPKTPLLAALPQSHLAHQGIQSMIVEEPTPDQFSYSIAGFSPLGDGTSAADLLLEQTVTLSVSDGTDVLFSPLGDGTLGLMDNSSTSFISSGSREDLNPCSM
jgi:hypothetical protein